MYFRKGFLGLGMFIFCFGMVCAKTVKVNCFMGKSINMALEKNQNVEELILEIDGICDENVIVRRDNVTLLGINLDPDTPEPGEPLDGIRGVSGTDIPPSFGNVLTIRDATNVTVENLRIFDGLNNGIFVQNSYRGISVINCILEDNEERGLSVRDARVQLFDSTVRGNGRDGVNVRQAAVRLTDCTIDAVGSEDGIAVLADRHSTAEIRNSEVTGSFAATRKSLIQLSNTTQIAIGIGLCKKVCLDNSISEDSQLLADDSSVSGPSEFSHFSTGLLLGDSKHNGDMTCESGSDVFCADPKTQIIGTTSNCASCLKKK